MAKTTPWREVRKRLDVDEHARPHRVDRGDRVRPGVLGGARHALRS